MVSLKILQSVEAGMLSQEAGSLEGTSADAQNAFENIRAVH